MLRRSSCQLVKALAGDAGIPGKLSSVSMARETVGTDYADQHLGPMVDPFECMESMAIGSLSLIVH